MVLHLEFKMDIHKFNSITAVLILNWEISLQFGGLNML